ncbi:MAG: HAMP domain-containing histidine kinase [Acidimicrobiia bacterium]|nr:HAMP domain-containing histidine kinase [Acidimicrobiia bacterium]
MRRTFFWSLMAAAALALAVGGVVAATGTNRQSRSEALQELGRQAEAIGRQAEQTFNEARAKGDDALRNLSQEGTIRSLLVTASQIGGHDYVEIAAVRQGELVVPSTSVLIPAFDLDEETFLPGRTVEFEGEVEGTPVVVVGRTIDTGTRAFSLVVLLGRESDLLTGVALVRAFLLALGAAVIVVAALAGLLARRLGARLARLDEAAGRVAAGDLTARVEDDGDDEVSHVADSFNEMAQKLEEAAQRERDFLLNVGHDLRTPLTSISGYAETLADGAIEAEELPRVAGVLQRQSNRLSRLVEDLMLLSRLEAREFTLRTEPVELGAHIGGVAEEFRSRAEAASVRLEVTIEPTGPVEADPVRVSQVISNLVENALRYAPEGGRVGITVQSAPTEIAIAVADNGPGIDAEDLPRVFERLFVAQRYRAVRPEGSGLGLSIVHELVAAMGGTVAVTSEPGRGTTVSVRLPRSGISE